MTRRRSMYGTYQFEIGDQVNITVSGENGKVIGRAEYDEEPPSYFVHYKTGDGRAVQSWWNAARLTAGAATNRVD
jgi:hypothetical protein